MAALGQALLPCPAVWIPMVMAVLLINLGSTYLWQFHRWTLYLQQCLIHCSCASAGGNTEAFRSSGLAMNVDIDKAGGDGMVVRDQRKTLWSLSALLFIPLISSRSTSLSLSPPAPLFLSNHIGWFGRKLPRILNSDEELLYQDFFKKQIKQNPTKFLKVFFLNILLWK